MTERVVCDADVRARVTTDLGTTFLLEAGAGTGKTRVLVDRYVCCVLDPDRGTGDVRTVVAITFTEKAAGELRQRVRERFEQLAVETSADEERAGVIRAALDALGRRAHRYHPRVRRSASAGVPGGGRRRPRVRATGPARLGPRARADVGRVAHRARRRRSRLRPGAPWPRSTAARRREAGVGALARRGPRGVFGERYDLEPVPPRLDEPDLRGALSGLGEALDRLAAYCGTACSNTEDKGCVAAMDLVDAGRALLARAPDGVDQLAAELFALPAKTTRTAPGGAKGNWSDSHGGKDELQSRYRSVVARISEARDAYAEFLTSLAVSVADAFSRWAAAAQLAQGRLDFTDLLGRLRDLLASDLAARAALQARFTYVLVDEFQDTDPLQAEIVFLLCERRPLASDWRGVVLQPGKLFVVGDPKQSIYRFRRADIGMYDQVKQLVAGQPDGSGALEVISQNFRTTPAVVNWVNNVFSAVFDDDEAEGRQPGYQWVEPYRPPAEGPRVAVLLGDDFGSAAGAADAARRAEAEALAALLLEMQGQGRDRWTVQDREASGAGAEVSRPPRWGDVAILFRATTGLETYEQAFREAGVPYRVEGGKAYFARREVDDLLLCLRAVDDPSDGPAVYGALHSTLFGFSDDELFLFWAAGGRFDLFTAQPGGHESVTAALATLRALHDQRSSSEPHELAAALVRVTRSAEVLAAMGPGGTQAIANLEKLVDGARAFTRAGGMGLGAFLAWAAEAGDAAGEQESQIDDDGDVVRLLTIHKAKGLEYPIVILAGGALGGGGGGGKPIVDREERQSGDQTQGGVAGSGGARPRDRPLHAVEGAREDHGGQRGPAPALRGGDACPGPSRGHLLRPSEEQGRRGVGGAPRSHRRRVARAGITRGRVRVRRPACAAPAGAAEGGRRRRRSGRPRPGPGTPRLVGEQGGCP